MRWLAWMVLAGLVAGVALPRDKKKKTQEEEQQEETQTLQLPKELPFITTVETSRMDFHVTPLTAKGLLSQQVKDSLKNLLRQSRGAPVVKIRAFVAGSGDLRRVHDIISDTFTDKHLALPSLSVAQVGALPLEGAQVVLEAISSNKKEINPDGLAFLSGQAATSPGPLDPTPPLVRKSLDDLRKAVAGVGAQAADVQRVTCFLSTLERIDEVRRMVAGEYPRAALDYIQTQRAPGLAFCECEAVARLHAKPAAPAVFANPAGLERSPNYSQAALVAAPTLVLTGTQVAFGFREADARLAFQRMAAALEQAGTSPRQVVFAGLYPLSGSLAEQVRRVRFEFFDKERPPACTLLTFEGLPSMDAAFAIDAVAVKSTN